MHIEAEKIHCFVVVFPGKQYMIAVDRDRERLATNLGYTVSLKSLQPLTCSPKNNLLIGQKMCTDTLSTDIT